MKIYLAQINTAVGDLDGNCEKILREFARAEAAECDLAVFSEMAVSGYPCEDLWQKKYFIRAVAEKISAFAKQKRLEMVGITPTAIAHALAEATK